MQGNPDSSSPPSATDAAAEPATKTLSPAARRALAEAEARRAEIEARVAAMPKEIGGRGGTEPVRYGDWEHNGLASDF